MLSHMFNSFFFVFILSIYCRPTVILWTVFKVKNILNCNVHYSDGKNLFYLHILYIPKIMFSVIVSFKLDMLNSTFSGIRFD